MDLTERTLDVDGVQVLFSIVSPGSATSVSGDFDPYTPQPAGIILIGQTANHSALLDEHARWEIDKYSDDELRQLWRAKRLSVSP